MKEIIIFFVLLFGVIFITYSVSAHDTEKPKEKIVYKYIPRTPKDELDTPVYVSDIFKTMFTQTSPWVGSINDLDQRKREQVNQYFVSQV